MKRIGADHIRITLSPVLSIYEFAGHVLKYNLDFPGGAVDAIKRKGVREMEADVKRNYLVNGALFWCPEIEKDIDTVIEIVEAKLNKGTEQ